MPDLVQIASSPRRLGLLVVDLQNDFVHPDGAYARGGRSSAAIAALPARVAPVARAVRSAGGLVVSTLFTLVPGRGGAPMISPHLAALRPFLGPGDFAPGSWGQAMVDEIGPADLSVEKVAYSAFHATRLEWVLRKAGIDRLLVAGIVTNGGVASTVRAAHVRDVDCAVLSDGCAAFSEAAHEAALADLGSVAAIATCDAAIAALAED